MNFTRKVLFTLYLILHTLYFTNAQVAINADGASPDASAMLDVTSTNKGILIPRMTTSERTNISSPATGLLVYDTDFNSFWYYESNEWVEITNNSFENIQSPELIKTISAGDEFSDMQQSGDYLYLVSQGNKRLYVYDISNRAAPTLASSLLFSSTTIKKIAIDGNYAYLTSYNTTNEFKVIDISDPTNISLAGEFDISGQLTAIAIDGNYAYATDPNNDKLLVIDISKPLSPVQVDDIAIDIRANDGEESIIIDNNYLYLGYKEDNVNKGYLSVVDISTPTTINIVGSLTVNGDGITHIVKKEDYLYFNTESSIAIIDVSTPATPSKLSSFGSFTSAIAASEDYLFMADYPNSSEEVSMYDISNLASPSLLYNYDTESNASAIDLIFVDGYLYSALSNGDLNIYQINYTAVNALGIDGTTTTYPLYDDLGDHTASENVQIDTFWLSNDGDDEGISISDDGNTTLSGTLTIGNTYTLPSSDGSASQILITDGSGSLSWSDNTDDQTIDAFSLSGNDLQLSLENDGQNAQTVDLSSFLDNTDDQTIDVFSLSGNNLQLSLENDGISTQTVDLSGIEISSIQDSDSDTKINLSSNDVIAFTLNGTEYFRMDEHQLKVFNTGNSIFIGEGAGDNDDLTSNVNTAIGYKALEANTNGNGNIAIGSEALYVCTSNFNTAIGNYSGYQTTGNSNVFIGYSAGQNITSGGNNVMIGTDAGGTSNVSNQLFIDNSNTNSPLIHGDFSSDVVEINGSLGINTTPTNATFEVLGSGDAHASYTFGYLNSSGSTGTWTSAPVYSIYADNKIAGFSFHAHSDERIKNIQGISNSKDDLNTLMNIEITDYTLKDTIANGKETTKKVIAQQVKEVYPQAVTNNTTEIVPDIFQTATIENNWVQLATDLKVGEKVQILFDDKKELLEVLEVKENAFRVKQATSNGQQATVFVYGRQVTDFHTVDYEAISMLNVSATQQLAKEVQQLKKENALLKSQVKRINQLEAQLEALLNNQ